MSRICSIPNYPNNKNYKNSKIINRIHKIEYIKGIIQGIIQDLENYGPAGLIHIAILSDIIQRPIKIWNANGSLNKIIGKKKTRHPIDIEYHAISSEGIGHWTLRGEKDPDNVIVDLNSCLFSVIGSQIGQDPLKLRKWTQLKLKVNFQNLVKWIDKTLQLEGNDKTILMIGGARYIGKTPEDAKNLLDRSHDVPSKVYVERCPKAFPIKGHARMHASHNEEDKYGRIEDYSKETRKTGFQSRSDMDFVAHLTLTTTTAQKFMKELNKGRLAKRIYIPFDILEEQRKKADFKDPLPLVREWKDGKFDSCQLKIDSVALILGHFEENHQKEEDVCIFTFYPILEKITF